MSRVELASCGAGVIVNASNQFVAGAQVHVYTTGTTTQVGVYDSVSGGSLLTQPLTSDAAGRIPGFCEGQQTVDFVPAYAGVTYPTYQVELSRGDTTASLDAAGGRLVLAELSVHASTHAAGGSDPISPASLGAVSSVFGRGGDVVAGNADYLAVAHGGLAGATAATRFVGGTASGAPGSGTFAKGDFVIDQTGIVWVCTTAGSPGTWANPSASAGVTAFNSRSGAVTPGNNDYLAVAVGGLTGVTAATRLVGATASGAPASGTFAKGDVAVDQTGVLWVCTTAGTPGTWANAGSSAGVSAFNSRSGTVTPGNADYLAVATGGLTGATAAARFVGGTASGAPASGTFAVGDFVVDQTGSIWICTGAGSPGSWIRSARMMRTSHTWALQGPTGVETGSSDLSNYIPPFFVALASGETVKAVGYKCVIGTGTSATVKLTKNGSDVTGFTAITVSTSASESFPTGVAVSAGDALKLVCTAVSGSPGNLSFSLYLEHTLS